MMDKKTIKNEEKTLWQMIEGIKKVTEVEQGFSEHSVEWHVEKSRLYQIASDLAVKIFLQELNVRATKKRIQQVSHELEEANFHCPVEAIFNLTEEITCGDYPMKIWHPDDVTSREEYRNEVADILNDLRIVQVA